MVLSIEDRDGAFERIGAQSAPARDTGQVHGAARFERVVQRLAGREPPESQPEAIGLGGDGGARGIAAGCDHHLEVLETLARKLVESAEDLGFCDGLEPDADLRDFVAAPCILPPRRERNLLGHEPVGALHSRQAVDASRRRLGRLLVETDRLWDRDEIGTGLIEPIPELRVLSSPVAKLLAVATYRIAKGTRVRGDRSHQGPEGVHGATQCVGLLVLEDPPVHGDAFAPVSGVSRIRGGDVGQPSGGARVGEDLGLGKLRGVDEASHAEQHRMLADVEDSCEGLHEIGHRDHVAVEQHDVLVPRSAGSEVANRRESIAPVGLTDVGDVEDRAIALDHLLDAVATSVVGDHHLHAVMRMGLMGECGERAPEHLAAVEDGHQHRDRFVTVRVGARGLPRRFEDGGVVVAPTAQPASSGHRVDFLRVLVRQEKLEAAQAMLIGLAMKSARIRFSIAARPHA